MPAEAAQINLAVKKTCVSPRFGIMVWKGFTPLLAAAMFSDSPTTLHLLVQSGANPGATFGMVIHPAMGALHAMAVNGSDECIRWWLDQKFPGHAGDIEKDAGSGQPPLG